MQINNDNNENNQKLFYNNFYDININNETRYNSHPLILKISGLKHMPSKNSESKQKQNKNKKKMKKKKNVYNLFLEFF